MSSNGDGTPELKPIGMGMAGQGLLAKSQGLTRKRSGAGRKSWHSTWLVVLKTVCACLELGVRLSKKRSDHREKVDGFGQG